MSKLFKLKDWLTLVDAAKHLSGVFEEEVTQADILRFALDDELVLSANFVNEAYCRVGDVVPIEEATFREVPSLVEGGEIVRVYRGPEIYTDEIETHILELEDEVFALKGVYDLPMIGGERHDVENRYQSLTGGPAITAVSMDGAFVRAEGGRICQIQDDFEDNEHCDGSRAQLEWLKANIARRNYSEAKAKPLLDRHREDRVKFLEMRAAQASKQHYYPRGSLPTDAVLVVRTKALADFIEAVNRRGRESDDLTLPPFFDADAEDYPKLLHIAVRAWEHARGTVGGTAKQRIMQFLADRYSELSTSERESIALIANWHKAGGRPKTGG